MQARRAFSLLVLAAALVAAPASAQERCSPDAAIGWLGLNYRCTSCTISSDSTNPSRFATEPVVVGLDDASPFAGQVQPGDVIVSINGELITSARGGMVLTTVRPGQVVVLQVRRDGVLRTVQSAALPARCPSNVISARAVAVGPAGGGGTMRAAGAMAGPTATSGLGFSISCYQCTPAQQAGRTSWRFMSPPEVANVAPGSAADRAGIRRGDRITAIDGLDITTAAAGDRFGAITPGTTVQLSLQRGTERFVREITAGAALSGAAYRAGQVTAGAGVLGQPRDNTLRYAGRLGPIDIDVRGSNGVIVTETADEIIITTADAVIRLRKQ